MRSTSIAKGGLRSTTCWQGIRMATSCFFQNERILQKSSPYECHLVCRANFYSGDLSISPVSVPANGTWGGKAGYLVSRLGYHLRYPSCQHRSLWRNGTVCSEIQSTG